jgi:hypothetical protein
MLRALARGYEVTGAERYRTAAAQAAGSLLATCRVDGRLRHAYRAGRTQPQVFLEDYSFLVAGLLDLYRATGEARWLAEAHALARTLVADFWDETSGTLYSTPRRHEPLLARLANAEDGATPSGQSMAALALVRLSRLTGNTELGAKARRLLTTHVTPMKRHPAAMPTMLLAAHQYFTPEGSAAAASAARRVVAELIGVPTRVRPGGLLPLRLRLTIAPGWHLNAGAARAGSARPSPPAARRGRVRPLGRPTTPTAAGLIGTEVTAAPGPFSVARVRYPPPESVRLGISKEPLPVLRGTVTIQIWVKAGADAARATAVRLRLHYQACSDTVCDQPVYAMVTAPIRSGPP